MEELERRRNNTIRRIEEFKAELKETEDRVKGKACVYVTGSFGRCESSPYSDLDLFIVGKSKRDEALQSELGRLDEILVKADLIELTNKLGIPEFDGEGKYLIHYPLGLLTKRLGTPEDDVLNTFTARLLLLLESRPILEAQVYRECIEEVIGGYWRDYADHKGGFVPAFLTNDILRFWRTLCVNYEARTKTDPAREKAKRKVKNFKLKHSRLLTCFSTILYLLGRFEMQKTVSPEDAMEMVGLTPTARLEWLLRQTGLSGAHECIERLLTLYDRFLLFTSVEEERLVDQFMDKKTSGKHLAEASEFGDKMFEALELVGNRNKFFRMLIV